MIKRADISDCGRFRFRLERIWNPKLPTVCFVMLNPSTADGETDDPTLRKCIGFAELWGFGALQVVNLYPYRATNPADLKTIDYMRGSEFAAARLENNAAWVCASARASLVVAAWGSNAKWLEVVRAKRFFPECKRIGPATKEGHPGHPLYLPYTLGLEPHFTQCDLRPNGLPT